MNTLVSIQDAATELSCGRTFLYEEMLRGRLRYVKAGRRRLISKQSIEAYVQLLEKEAGYAIGSQTLNDDASDCNQTQPAEAGGSQ